MKHRHDDTGVWVSLGTLRNLERQRDEARELARELRDALERVINQGHADNCLFLLYADGRCDCGVDDASAIINKAKEVLP
jgi:hypothetical protein